MLPYEDMSMNKANVLKTFLIVTDSSIPSHVSLPVLLSVLSANFPVSVLFALGLVGQSAEECNAHGNLPGHSPLYGCKL